MSTGEILSLPPLVWFAGATIGHAVLWVFIINWTSAVVREQHFLGLLRRTFFSVLFAGPVLFFWAYGLDRYLPWQIPEADGLRHCFVVYGLACCALGLSTLALATVSRWLRRQPAALTSNHTQTVDIAAQLGFKPFGHGKYRRMARLPYNEIFKVDFNEKVLRPPRLPGAWDGLTILHLSDLHFIGIPDKVFYQQVMDRCREWAPDVVALTGDIVDSDQLHRWILPVLGRLQWRIAAFAILGNHDYWQDPPLVRRRLRKVGFSVLDNRSEQISVRGHPMLVIGHEGPWFQPPPDLINSPTGTFRLCLSHTPDNVYWARRHDIDLMLSGHNHGGQVRFPLLGSVFAPSRFSRRFDCGVFHLPPTLLHVSRGLAGKHPLRYYCRPEVTKIVLRANPS